MCFSMSILQPTRSRFFIMNFTNGAACSVELGGWWWWCGMGVISMVGCLHTDTRGWHGWSECTTRCAEAAVAFESETRRKGTEGETGDVSTFQPGGRALHAGAGKSAQREGLHEAITASLRLMQRAYCASASSAINAVFVISNKFVARTGVPFFFHRGPTCVSQRRHGRAEAEACACSVPGALLQWCSSNNNHSTRARSCGQRCLCRRRYWLYGRCALVHL